MTKTGFIGLKYKSRSLGLGNKIEGCPETLGKKIMEFIKTVNLKEGWDTLKENLYKIRLLSRTQIQKRIKSSMHKTLNSAFESLYQEIANNYCVRFGFHKSLTLPVVSFEWNWCTDNALRNGEFLYSLFYGKLQGKTIANEFSDCVKDKFEFTYIINLDNMTLECYSKGEQVFNPNDSINKYHYPGKLLAQFQLGNIPPNWTKVYSFINTSSADININ